MKKGTEQQYWFRPKRYGWGWGLPQTREGWTVYAVFMAIWLAALAWLVSTPDSSEAGSPMNSFALIMLLDVGGLIYFSFKYGEPPKWRWGKKKS